jgi:hypothetical protein
MADGKKSVILYCDIIHTFEALDDLEAGRLIKHYLRYINDLNPEPPDKITKIVFEPIKQQLKRDLVKWEGIRHHRSDAGKASAEKRKQKQQKSTSVDKSQQTSTPSTVNANVNVNVNERESTAPANGLENSNLFRKPKIPTKHDVLKAIVDAGGDKEMAKSFFEKHEGTGWFINGSPIVNYVALAQKFVSTWKSISESRGKKDKAEPTAPPLTRLKAE